jgi:hypothetical protein
MGNILLVPENGMQEDCLLHCSGRDGRCDAVASLAVDATGVVRVKSRGIDNCGKKAKNFDCD